MMPNRPADMPLWYPVESDPPLHDILRKVLDPFLSPKAVRAHEPAIRAIVNDLIDSFIDAGEVEIVSQFANLVPGRVFCSVVAGMPEEDMPYLQERFQAGIIGPLELRGVAMTDALNYMTKYLESRTKEPPRGDVVDAILAFEWDGEPGYEFVDRAGSLAALTQGGIGTTGMIFAGALYHLARNPDDRRRLIEDPSLIPTAIEEFLRYYASAPQLARRTMKPSEVEGTKIGTNEVVVLSFGAASRDPAVCPNPKHLDIERTPNRHLAFGAGKHRCAGSHLARINLRVGLEVFLERIPDFTVPEDFVPEYQVGVTRDMHRLPLEFARDRASA
jgi:cytochrome P450